MDSEAVLTDEEWAEREFESKYGTSRTSVHVDHKGRIFAHDLTTEHVVIVNESYDTHPLLALRALCNDALPDDDPRKITWADVKEIAETAAFIEDGTGGWSDGSQLRLIAAKLSALLPPSDGC